MGRWSFRKNTFYFSCSSQCKSSFDIDFLNTLVFSESCVLYYTLCFCIIDLGQCCLKCVIDPADEMASVSGRKPWAISPGSVYSRVWWTATPTSTKFLCTFPPEFKTDLFVGSHFFSSEENSVFNVFGFNQGGWTIHLVCSLTPPPPSFPSIPLLHPSSPVGRYLTSYLICHLRNETFVTVHPRNGKRRWPWVE